MGKTVVIDLDGTLAQYDHWRGPDHIGEMIPLAHLGTGMLKAAGYYIVIWTTRGDVKFVKTWLDKNRIVYDAINSCEHNPVGCSTKPIADVYIDDRAVTFDGDWMKTVGRVLGFEPRMNSSRIKIKWQGGPIKEVGVNGVRVEDVIRACINRLIQLNGPPNQCDEIDCAIELLKQAVKWLDGRTARRTGIEGTSAPERLEANVVDAQM